MTHITHKTESAMSAVPRHVELSGNERAQLKETERSLLNSRNITPKQCRYLDANEIAEVLLDTL